MITSTHPTTFSSGLASFDQLLEGLRWGDVVAFHLSDLQDFSRWLLPAVEFLKTQNIPCHYVHFSERQSVSCPEILTPPQDLSQLAKFQEAGEKLFQVITENPPNSFYILDNVTALLKIANTEADIVQLVENVCLQIAARHAVAYLPLERGALSKVAVAQIKDAVSVFLDVWRVDQALYFQPIKVLGRYSENVFQRYRLAHGTIEPAAGIDFAEYARTLEVKSREFLELYSQKRKFEKELQRKLFELSLINELTASLLSTMHLDEILYQILIGVTAKEGLGFNRAFLLLVNEQEKVLEGKMAIGPSNLDEALRIWTDLSNRNLTFPQLLASFDENWQQRDVYVNQIVRQIQVPLSNRSHLLVDLLQHMQSEIISRDTPFHLQTDDILQLLEVQSFAAVPLLYRKRCLGLLLADNLISQKEITQEDLQTLETFANYASSAIEHSRLYEEVRTRIQESERHIRELEAMQNRLMRSKKLSELGELASKMAHEIRTPLVCIGGFANTILKRQSPDSSDYEYLKIIVDEVRRLEETIMNVLAYVSPGIPRAEPVFLNAILDHVLFMMKSALEERNITVETRYGEELPQIWADLHQMKQVFTAIINNAIESMPSGGRLGVTISRHHNDFVRISISDTGVGIAEDKLDKVFDAFFTTKSTGSGLGLNIASQIVANHKGSIYVESQVGVGSAFIINLPLMLREETLP